MGWNGKIWIENDKLIGRETNLWKGCVYRGGGVVWVIELKGIYFENVFIRIYIFCIVNKYIRVLKWYFSIVFLGVG